MIIEFKQFLFSYISYHIECGNKVSMVEVHLEILSFLFVITVGSLKKNSNLSIWGETFNYNRQKLDVKNLIRYKIHTCSNK